MLTGFVYETDFLIHDTGNGHPENSKRLTASINHLKSQPWFESLRHITARIVEREWIEKVHAHSYVERAKSTCLSGASFLDSMDVGICRESYDIAILAAGAPIAIADKILNEEINNGFALLRPPGHHAENSMAMGFCLFNNVAILARYLQRQHGIDKILIMDWDVHHGNGTQHIFDEDPSVLYVSIHQYPYYPGTGAYTETGINRGNGATLNCPLPAGSDNRDYENTFMEKVLPKVDQFQPEFVIISAGFDAHIDDPLAQINLTTDFFGWMTERLMEKADQYCQGRIVSVLEGGYNLNVLPHCIEKHLSMLLHNE